jgi:F-type H+-transporting ATPase subunit delta
MTKNKSLKYAKALFQLASETKQVDKIKTSFEKLEIFYNRETISFFSNPLADETIKRDLIKNAFAHSPTILLNLLFLLVDKKAIHLLSDIEKKYNNLVLSSENTISAEIISFDKIEKQHIDKIKKTLTQITNKNIVTTEKIDKSLIGGLTIQTDNLFIDGSVKGKIDLFNQEFYK